MNTHRTTDAFLFLLTILMMVMLPGVAHAACVGGAANGLLEPSEVCDDGNSTNGDGCSSLCAVETGFSCNIASPTVCGAVCSDSLIKGSEGCDDGGLTNNDGCSMTCTVESGYTCTGEPSTCTVFACGNGVKQGAEGCDDGNTNNSDGCSSTCTVESGYTCSGAGPNSCTAVCGNGSKNGSETCDDSNTTSGDGCSSTCAAESGYTCTGAGASSCAATCGDSLIKGSEGCDDGNTNASDGCSATCTVESGYSCSGTPSTCNACGDGTVGGAEGCDDSNTTNNDGCSSTCITESGWTCSGTLSTCNKCGNSVIAGGEGCDDGNTTASDGCSATCTVESGYSCSGTPSTCTNQGIGGGGTTGGDALPPAKPAGPPPPCGNAVLQPEKCEECDNGRANGTSACTQQCTLLYCGDGAIATHLKEECEGRIAEERTKDPRTGQIVAHFWFIVPSCGQSCTLPAWQQKPRGIWEQNNSTGCKRDLSFPPCQGTPTERRIEVRPPFSCATSSSSLSSASTSSTSSRPKNCGDAILQTKEGEECDRVLYDLTMVQPLGKRKYGCSSACKVIYCGDREITPFAPLSEECDPEHATYRNIQSCTTGERLLGCTKECRLFPLKQCPASPPPQEKREKAEKSEELPESAEEEEGFEEEEVVPEKEAEKEEPTASPTSRPAISPVPIFPTLPMVPTTPFFCGNGMKERGEQCDDGNSTNTDLCSNQCAIAQCGDGIVQGWETCDPPTRSALRGAGHSNGDDCPSSCKKEEVSHAAAEEHPVERSGEYIALLLLLAGITAMTQKTGKRWMGSIG